MVEKIGVEGHHVTSSPDGEHPAGRTCRDLTTPAAKARMVLAVVAVEVVEAVRGRASEAPRKATAVVPGDLKIADLSLRVTRTAKAALPAQQSSVDTVRGRVALLHPLRGLVVRRVDQIALLLLRRVATTMSGATPSKVG